MSPHLPNLDDLPCDVRFSEILGFHVAEVNPFAPGTKEHEATPPSRVVYFSHATGIASETYLDVLCRWALAWNARVYAYDMRGIGRTRMPAPGTRRLFGRAGSRKGVSTGEIPDLLVADACELFWELKGLEARRATARGAAVPPWSFAGHSFGGWIALHAAARCHVRHIVLLDISILPPSTAALWAFACAIGRRNLHTLAKQARLRKRRYRSAEEAKRVFRRLAFFKGWDARTVARYFDANYADDGEGFTLRHDPAWEARIYESQQASAALSFLALGKGIREHLEVLMIVGGASDACDPAAGPFFRSFFPRARWVVLPEAGHMYPFSRPATLLGVLETLAPSGVVARPSEWAKTVEPSKRVEHIEHVELVEPAEPARRGDPESPPEATPPLILLPFDSVA